jgi:RNA polymerase sigma-70 factor (ECF subfamily)
MSGEENGATRPSLLARLRNLSDREAWQEFAGLYSPLIHAYLRRRGLQEADAADVAQVVLQRVAQSITKLEYDRSKGRFRGWLLTITRQRMIDHLARRKKEIAGSGDSDVQALINATPDDEDARQWDRECEEQVLQWAMRKLEPEFEPSTWRAFYGTAIENRPADEVANQLQMTVGAVYTAKSRVTARLRRAIQQLEDDG